MTFSTANGIDEQVKLAILHHPHLNRNQLHFKTTAGRVTLEGQVASYFEKQMAQEALRQIEGVDEIDNLLTVKWSS